LVLLAISQVGPPALSHLPSIKRALDDNELSVRIAAAFAVGRLDPDDKGHQRILIDAMRAGEGGIIVRVGQLGESAEWAVPTLIELLGDQRPGIRRITADALERIGPVAIAAKPTLIRLVTDDPEESVRDAAQRALGWMNTPVTPGP